MKNNNVIKNVFSSLIVKFIAIIYGFIVPILIIKKYGSNVNGLISSIAQFIAYISLLEAGIGPIIKNALFKPLIKKNSNDIANILGAASKFFKKISYVLVIYILLLCLIYPYFNDNFSYLYTISLILIISISQFTEYFFGMTYRLFLQADQKNYIVDYTNAIGYVLNIILIIILIKLNYNIQLVKLISAIIYVLKPIILKIYFDKYYGYKIKNNSNYKFDKQWDGLAHHIAASVQSSIDITTLTLFSNLNNVSIYSVYALVTNGIRSIIVSLTNGIDAFFGKKMITDKEDTIKEKFIIYNFFFYTISTILIICTIYLIIPFITIYTKDITDTNYVKPLFAYILVFSEFNFIIRYPFSTIVYAKGHFKETRNFSILEPIINIVISTILVFKYGLVGIAIGTFVSMLIRSFGFITYASKKILKIKLFDATKMIIISYIELTIFFVVFLLIKSIQINNYLEWGIYALILFVIVTIVICLTNCLLNKQIVKTIINKIKK